MFDISKFYPGFVYPNGYFRLKELKITDFGFWYFIPESQMEDRVSGLIKRYPNRKLIPFARRDDNDDIACFEIGKGKKIEVIHDFSSSGYEQRNEYNNIWFWAKEAFEELIDSETN